MDTKQCKSCKHRFSLSSIGGKWIRKWFHVKCPKCEAMLATQTSWPYLRPVTSIDELAGT